MVYITRTDLCNGAAWIISSTGSPLGFPENLCAHLISNTYLVTKMLHTDSFKVIVLIV